MLMRLADILRRATTLHPRFVLPLVSVALGYRTLSGYTQHGRNQDPSDDYDCVLSGWAAKITFGRDDVNSLYQNAALFVRVVLPFGVWIRVRWRGDRPDVRSSFSCGVGYKLNGTLGATFRVQSDASSARGTHGPNYGQPGGWWRGPA